MKSKSSRVSFSTPSDKRYHHSLKAGVPVFLKSISIENVGPIISFKKEMPFRDGKPLPVVLVGENGSGKTTVLSHIISALTAFKQAVYENIEIDKGTALRIRGSLYLHAGKHWYHVRLDFDESWYLEEWVLDRPRNRFESEVSPLPIVDTWKQIPEFDKLFLKTEPAARAFPGFVPNQNVSQKYREHVVLYYPSDRFEIPDWLNSKNLKTELELPKVVSIREDTPRRIFSKSLLRPILEWLEALQFDRFLFDRQVYNVPLTDKGTNASRIVPMLHFTNGPVSKLLEAVTDILRIVLGADAGSLNLLFGGRSTRLIAVSGLRNGKTFTIPSLLGLSAGQSGLLCLFANILRDFDLAGNVFDKTESIKGIVLIDEADLHLHLYLLHDVFPKLLKLFPNIQFIITAHSPMLILGLRQELGEDGFGLFNMPEGNQISPELYTEFDRAYGIVSQTTKHSSAILIELNKANKPVVLVEGKSDVTHLYAAWRNLFPGKVCPFAVVPCGGESDDGTSKGKSGAQALKAILEAMSWYEDRPLLGLFDNDSEGFNQFNSLNKNGYQATALDELLTHKSRKLHAMLLPTPSHRALFVPSNPSFRVLAIEHFYSDDQLHIHNMADNPIFDGLSVYPIKKKGKIEFSQTVDQTFTPTEFVEFQPLFNQILSIFSLPFST
jgi:AAA domain, putative AbiEii toxin, Type IV TA system